MNVSSYLTVSDSYRRALPEVVASVVNGCGPGGWKYDLVPDTLYGLKVTESCNSHDWDYHMGETDADKAAADLRLLCNLIATIDHAAQKIISGKILKPFRYQRAFEYYCVVKEGGNDAFWEGKEQAA